MSKHAEANLGRIARVLGGALLALTIHVTAQAHVVTGALDNWCSPHDADKSGGGSQFGNCYRTTSTDRFNRDIYCPAGTTCSNALCSGTQTCGSAYSDGSTAHGGNGGHKASVTSTVCSSTCVVPVEFDNAEAYDIEGGNWTATAGITLKTNGEVTLEGNEIGGNLPFYPESGQLSGWMAPAGTTGYEVYATQTAGNQTPSGLSLNTWYSLGSSNRTWLVNNYSVGTTKYAVLQFTVRETGTTSPTWVSSNITLTAERLDSDE